MPKTPSKILKNMPSPYVVYEPIKNTTKKILNTIGKVIVRPISCMRLVATEKSGIKIIIVNKALIASLTAIGILKIWSNSIADRIEINTLTKNGNHNSFLLARPLKSNAFCQYNF